MVVFKSFSYFSGSFSYFRGPAWSGGFSIIFVFVKFFLFPGCRGFWALYHTRRIASPVHFLAVPQQLLIRTLPRSVLSHEPLGCVPATGRPWFGSVRLRSEVILMKGPPKRSFKTSTEITSRGYFLCLRLFSASRGYFQR